MIEVLIKCPFEVWQLNDEDFEGREIEITETESDLIEGSLNQNYNFLVDLNDYAEPGQLKTSYILPDPCPKFDELNRPYLEVHAYSVEDSLTDRDLGKIAEYVMGEVSDGWGENGFDLWGDKRLELNWENAVHRGCRVISDGEFQEILQRFKFFQKHAFQKVCPDYDPETEAKTLEDLMKDLCSTLGQLADELHAIADKKEAEKEILDQVEQLKTSVEAGLND